VSGESLGPMHVSELDELSGDRWLVAARNAIQSTMLDIYEFREATPALKVALDDAQSTLLPWRWHCALGRPFHLGALFS